MSTDLSNPRLCSACKEYYTIEYDECSVCRSMKQYTNLTLDIIIEDETNDSYKIPTHVREKWINSNLHLIYEKFKESLPCTLIKSSNEKHILINKLKQCSPSDAALLLWGKKEFPSHFLEAKEVDDLLEYFETSNHNPMNYRYIHAIAAFSFDIWNTRSKNNLLLCYHKEFGEIRCPSTINKLINYWRFKHNYWLNSCIDGDVVIYECVICNNDIKAWDKSHKCLQCNQISCQVCVLKWANTCWKNMHTLHCPHCRLDWNNNIPRISQGVYQE